MRLKGKQQQIINCIPLSGLEKNKKTKEDKEFHNVYIALIYFSSFQYIYLVMSWIF